ncbi:hypothetical protein KPL70_000248 [Citrus sinensis]|uniref:Uncharacterized protein n=1 Tax=Citrus sinensis TaxID=2711 RepID=A0ACB8NMM8_CITSI|nr:hypothetical protein KPL70_000248 [Citrus sinensis]KAH9799133.1 hypothetical protein KPL71_000249 [Citrus sinensis]
MFFLLLFSSFLNQASLSSIIQPVSVPITFNNFNPDSCNNGNDLICMGSVTAGNGYLSLTPEPYSTLPPPLNKVGRVLFHQPVLAWPAMFTTTFTVRISKFPDATGSGDGMAFVMAQDNKPPPPNGYGSYLGIMDKSTQDGVVRQLAVELDTYMNEYMIPDGNHIGVDTTSMATPVAAKSLNSTGIDLKSGRNITVKIDYDGAKTVPNAVYVGFTASTGLLQESHQLLDRVFVSFPIEFDEKGQSKVDGDLGLARLIQNDACVTTMMAGTPGYLAPEVSFSGKATPEFDVYSFGMVALEVACGRRSKGLFEENSLVDYVWSLYGKNALLECVDKQLEGEFDEEQVKRTLTVGFASLHPDCMLRPKIRKVVQIFLNPNEPLMDLPHARPNAVYVSVSSASTADVGSSSVATADETRTPDDKA